MGALLEVGEGDRVGAGAVLEAAAEAGPGSYHLVEARQGRLLADVVLHGTDGRREATALRVARIVGFLRLTGLERVDVLEVVDHYALVEPGTLEAAAWNPSLRDEDVAGLAPKLWMGNPQRAGSLLPGARRRLRESPRAVAQALGALSDGWYDSATRIVPLSVQLGAAGEEGVEVFETLARDAVHRERLSHLDARRSEELVKQALLLVR